MSLTGEIPPVIARQRARERDFYIRARPERRVQILCDYAKSSPLAEDDQLALAFEEVRLAYHSQLPPGEYRNARGHAFVVSDYGRPSAVPIREPPVQGLVWAPTHWRPTPSQVPSGYHFVLGGWQWGPPTPPFAAPIVCFGASQQHQYQVPADLEGATFTGVLPEIPQHFQSGGLLLPDLDFAVAATPLQQLFDLPTAPMQEPLSPSAEPYQQPAASDPLTEEEFGDLLLCTLQQDIEKMDAEAVVQLPRSDSAIDLGYPGYAPASFS